MPYMRSAMPRPMSADEYAKALDRLGLSNRGFCINILGVEDKTGRNWKSGASPVPGAVAALLRLAIRCKVDGDKLHDLLGD
jgi:DNA-binding transcriptional regulator YiaG